MSECVVRMPYPKDCESCHLKTRNFFTGDFICAKTHTFLPASGKNNNCPIICQLPEGHGELIERSKLFDWYTGQRTKYPVKQDAPQFGTMMMYEIFGEIDDAPTIVPAEAERSET